MKYVLGSLAGFIIGVFYHIIFAGLIFHGSLTTAQELTLFWITCIFFIFLFCILPDINLTITAIVVSVLLLFVFHGCQKQKEQRWLDKNAPRVTVY